MSLDFEKAHAHAVQVLAAATGAEVAAIGETWARECLGVHT